MDMAEDTLTTAHVFIPLAFWAIFGATHPAFASVTVLACCLVKISTNSLKHTLKSLRNPSRAMHLAMGNDVHLIGWFA
jgi:hypothetical protein